MLSTTSSLPVPLLSPLLTEAGFQHGFFTRQGGASTGAFATLNTSQTVGDAPSLVLENLQRIAARLSVRPQSLCAATQVHGCQILELSSTDRAVDVAARQADALIASSAGPSCCVRTADCVPILVADKNRGTVAAIHAGWRGVESQILPLTIRRLETLGCEQSALVLAVGPHISAKHFEVGKEVADKLSRASSSNRAVQWPLNGERPRVSLVEILRQQLLDCGLLSSQIDVVAGCTVEDATQFYSFRRDGKITGRMLNAIVPRNDRL